MWAEKFDWKNNLQVIGNNNLYYIDAILSVLLENNQWHIFHILTLEKILMMSFTAFCNWMYIMKRKLHGGLKIWILSSRCENNLLLTRYPHSYNIISPVKDKIHIFTSPCNILSLFFLHTVLRHTDDTCTLHVGKVQTNIL